MATASSRYRNVPLVSAPDGAGRLQQGTGARLAPPATAMFRHLVSQSDRLDGLAARYYNEPTAWWQICDANPDVLSPLDLLADPPVRVTALPLTWAPPDGSDPPWSELIGRLQALVGVERVVVRDEVTLVAQSRTVDGRQVTITLPVPIRAVEVTHNPATATVPDLLEAATATGLTAGWPQELGRVGQEILIPPVRVG